MLEMRRFCECCAKSLPPEASEALICSFECTFCLDCARNRLGGVCPNCGGDLVARPARAVKFLVKNPASTARIVKENGCSETAQPSFCAVGANH